MRAERRTAASLSYVLSGTSAVVVISLILFYAIELPTGRLHVFGPLSDIGTVAWDLLFVPLAWGVGRSLFPAGLGRAVTIGAVVVSICGAVSSALLVAKALSFGPSTTVSVLAVLAQSLWLYVVSRQLRKDPSWGLPLVRLGLVMPIAQAFAAVLFGISLIFGWGTRPQLAVMIIGVVPGVLAWAAWPLWFALVARRLQASVPVAEMS